MMKLLIAILLLGVIAVNGLLYLKVNALETRVSQLQSQSLAGFIPYSDTPPPVSDPTQDALLKEAAPLLEKARTAIQNADYSKAQELLREARGPASDYTGDSVSETGRVH